MIPLNIDRPVSTNTKVMTTNQFDICANVAAALLSMLLFGVSLFNSLLGQNYTTGFWVVMITDCYLLYVLIYAGLKSDRYRKNEWWMGKLIPGRTAGIFIFLLLYASVVNGFAAMFMDVEAPKYTTINSSVYHSFIGLSAFNYEDYSGKGQHFWRLQM